MNSYGGTRLHPTRASHARSYEPSFRDVNHRINDAIRRAYAIEKKYNKVAVLSLRWSNDDMNLGKIEAELLETLRDVFNFPTESFLIQHNDSAFASQTVAWSRLCKKSKEKRIS